jgi:large subunit ribosomal protein L21
MSYAIITVGGKQYRVRKGEWLLVDRLPIEEGKTFHPDVLLIGGDGEVLIEASELKGRRVTARVTAHVLGKKVIVGKHKQRTGYRRRNGFRARLSEIQIESIAKRPARAAAARKAEAPAKTEPAEEASTLEPVEEAPKPASRTRKKTTEE